jgi:ribosomal protein L31
VYESRAELMLPIELIRGFRDPVYTERQTMPQPIKRVKGFNDRFE